MFMLVDTVHPDWTKIYNCNETIFILPLEVWLCVFSGSFFVIRLFHVVSIEI